MHRGGGLRWCVGGRQRQLQALRVVIDFDDQLLEDRKADNTVQGLSAKNCRSIVHGDRVESQVRQPQIANLHLAHGGIDGGYRFLSHTCSGLRAAGGQMQTLRHS